MGDIGVHTYGDAAVATVDERVKTTYKGHGMASDARRWYGVSNRAGADWLMLR